MHQQHVRKTKTEKNRTALFEAYLFPSRGIFVPLRISPLLLGPKKRKPLSVLLLLATPVEGVFLDVSSSSRKKISLHPLPTVYDSWMNLGTFRWSSSSLRFCLGPILSRCSSRRCRCLRFSETQTNEKYTFV